MIIAGWSAYPRQLDFARVPARSPTRSARYLMVDMAHFAGLVAAGLHPNPVPHADVVTTTTHKTLGGPRGGIILTNERLAKKINSAVFPGMQGGPLEHVIAAKAVAFKLAAERGVRGAAAAHGGRREDPGRAADRARTPAAGVSVLTGGTDVHLVLVDLRRLRAGRPAGRGPAAPGRDHGQPQRRPERPAPADGHLRAADRHARRWPPAASAAEDFTEVADIIAAALQAAHDDARPLAARVEALAAKHPLYPTLAESVPRVSLVPRPLPVGGAPVRCPCHLCPAMRSHRMADQRLRPVLDRHRPVELPHGRADARGARCSPAGCATTGLLDPGRRGPRPSCSARSAPPATATAPRRRCCSAWRARPRARSTSTAPTPASSAIREHRAGSVLLGEHEIPFAVDDDLVLHRRRSLPFHPNGMPFIASTPTARSC